MMQKAEYLAKAKMLGDLSSKELSRLGEDFELAEYAKGTVIIQQNCHQHSFYVVAEGTLEMTVVESADEPPLVVNNMGQGDTFGCTSFFSGDPAAASITCLSDCKILQIDEQKFTAMLARWPKLYKKFAETLSHRLHAVNEGLMESRHREILRSGLQNKQVHNKFYGIWGAGKTNAEIEANLNKLATSQDPVLFLGEHGTGKEMAAWFLHKRQFGEKAPFIVMRARHFAETWADTMEVAKKGTLFIEDINLLEEHAQKLLTACLTREDCGFRLIGSMTRPPAQAVPSLLPELEGFFTFSMPITPLRSRKRDIPVLSAGILDKLAVEDHRPKLEVDREAMKLLLSHDYREGNMTELIQVLKRAYYLAEGNTIGLEHIFFGPTAKRVGQRINLLEWAWFADIINKGQLILWLRRLGTALSLTILLLLFLGPTTPVGLLTLPFIWGLGWPLMAMVSPSFGRVICTVCPVAYMMQQIQKVFHLNLRVPEILKKYDYLFITFLFSFIFWIESVSDMRTNPVYTGLLFSAIMSMAFLVGILFPRHAWCRHLCPMGNFMGMASIGSFAEVRADTNVCINKCTTFDCYKGTDQLEGCPLSMQLPYVDNNLACKLCFNCVRNCPNGAVQVNLRVPAREVWHMVRVNQGFVVLIGVALGILLPIAYFRPLHQTLPKEQWSLLFSLWYWGSAVVAGGLTWLIARPFSTKAASKRVKSMFALIPVILSCYVIYQLNYLPGAGRLFVGLNWLSSNGSNHPVSISMLLLIQVLAGLIGVILSASALILVAGYKKLNK